MGQLSVCFLSPPLCLVDVSCEFFFSITHRHAQAHAHSGLRQIRCFTVTLQQRQTFPCEVYRPVWRFLPPAGLSWSACSGRMLVSADGWVFWEQHVRCGLTGGALLSERETLIKGPFSSCLFNWRMLNPPPQLDFLSRFPYPPPPTSSYCTGTLPCIVLTSCFTVAWLLSPMPSSPQQLLSTFTSCTSFLLLINLNMFKLRVDTMSLAIESYCAPLQIHIHVSV